MALLDTFLRGRGWRWRRLFAYATGRTNQTLSAADTVARHAKRIAAGAGIRIQTIPERGLRATKASAAALTLSWSLPGCTTATIKLAEGPPIEADIEGGTESSIIVFGDHGRREIRRSEIVDVDHPGDGQMAAGAIGLGVAALALLGGACSNQPEYTDSQGKTSCTLALVPGGLGLANLLVGIVINTQSKNALADTSLTASEARLRLVRVPPPIGQ